MQMSAPPKPPCDAKVNPIPGLSVPWLEHQRLGPGLDGGIFFWIEDEEGKPLEWVKISLSNPWPQGAFISHVFYGFSDAEGCLQCRPSTHQAFDVWVEEHRVPLIQGIVCAAPQHPEAQYTPDVWRIVIVKSTK